MDLNHRATLKKCAFSSFRNVTAAEVPYLNCKTDQEATDAMSRFILMEAACAIIKAETGEYPDREKHLLIWREFGKHAPNVKDPGDLIDRVLEGVPGSLTYKPMN